MGRTRKKPGMKGREVPMARISRNDEVSPGKTACAIVENRKADSPNPDITNPVVVARYIPE